MMRFLSFIVIVVIPVALTGQLNSDKITDFSSHGKIVRDSLIGEYKFNPLYSYGKIDIYNDSTCEIVGIPGCYSCMSFPECGTWRIKGKHIIVENYPDSYLLQSKFLNDSVIYIYNTLNKPINADIFKNGQRSILLNQEKEIKISKENVDSLWIYDGFYNPMKIYNRTDEDDFYIFRIYNSCSSEDFRYKFKILKNYNLKGYIFTCTDTWPSAMVNGNKFFYYVNRRIKGNGYFFVVSVQKVFNMIHLAIIPL